MKTNFKKTLSVVLAVLTLVSIMSISASAAVYNVILTPDENCSPSDKPIEMQTDASGYIVFPAEDEEVFTREGHSIYGWNKRANMSQRTWRPGQRVRMTSNTAVYPVWRKNKYDCTFVAGEGATISGTASYTQVDYGTMLTPPTLTKPNYVHIGWSKTEGSDKAEIGATETFMLRGNTTYYAVWVAPKYEISASTAKVTIPTNCVLKSVGSTSFDIINTGNQTITINDITSSKYTFAYSGSKELEMGEKITVTVTPVANLPIGDHSEVINITGSNGVSASISVFYAVVDHEYDVYKSNDDATYDREGTKTAVCINGCGDSSTIIDEGSMKKYDAANNTAKGLLKEYLYHKTIRFTAFGSGMDDYDFVIGKKWLPESWYVNEQYNGTFDDKIVAEDGEEKNPYDVCYVHDTFGTYELKLTFVEMEIELDAEGNPVLNENDELQWKPCLDEEGNPIKDVKTFTYRVGPSAKEQQDVVMPNMIVNIIFGLFGYFFEVIQQFFG